MAILTANIPGTVIRYEHFSEPTKEIRKMFQDLNVLSGVKMAYYIGTISAIALIATAFFCSSSASFVVGISLFFAAKKSDDHAGKLLNLLKVQISGEKLPIDIVEGSMGVYHFERL